MQGLLIFAHAEICHGPQKVVFLYIRNGYFLTVARPCSNIIAAVGEISTRQRAFLLLDCPWYVRWQAINIVVEDWKCRDVPSGFKTEADKEQMCRCEGTC